VFLAGGLSSKPATTRSARRPSPRANGAKIDDPDDLLGCEQRRTRTRTTANTNLRAGRARIRNANVAHSTVLRAGGIDELSERIFKERKFPARRTRLARGQIPRNVRARSGQKPRDRKRRCSDVNRKADRVGGPRTARPSLRSSYGATIRTTVGEEENRREQVAVEAADRSARWPLTERRQSRPEPLAALATSSATAVST